MNPAYNIIATAIYTETPMFTSGLAIVYNGIRICVDFEVLKMVNIFSFNKFTHNDLRNILYITSQSQEATRIKLERLSNILN